VRDNGTGVFVLAILACTGPLNGCGGGSTTTVLAVVSASLPNGTVGTPYTPMLEATGGTPGYTWSQTSGGAMPDGVTLSSAGQFSGTPTVAGTFGPYVFQVKDSASPTAATATSASLSITIAGASLSVTTGSLPSGTVGAAYSVTLTAVGGSAPYIWTETSGGALPPGIANVTSAGAIAGTPTTPGSYGPYVFTVTDSKNATAASVRLGMTISGTAAAKCTSLGNEAVLNAATPYAFLLKGRDGGGNPIDIAGSFTPDGNGGITNAAIDYNGYSNGPLQPQVSLTGSSYAFATSTLGCLSLSFSRGPGIGVSGVTFSFRLAGLDGSGVYHAGRIIESDNVNGTGTNASGSLHVQTATDFGLSALQGRYAFGVEGWSVAPANSGLYRNTFAGSFSNTNGTISAGYADLNQGGTITGELSGGSGQLGAIDPGTGRGTGSFVIPAPTGSSYTFAFTFYVINGSAAYLLSRDSPIGVGAAALLAGRALVSNATFRTTALDGTYLLAEKGLDTAGNSGSRGRNIAEIGMLNATSAGAIPSAMLYLNDAGTYTSQGYRNGTYVVEAASGRASLMAGTTMLPAVYLTADSALDDGVAGFAVGNDAMSQSGLLVSQTMGTPNYTLPSVVGNFASGTEEDVDGVNGAFLGTFTFSGTGGYTVVSETTGSISNAPQAQTIAINADGSGSLDGGKFPFVTNGNVLFVIPDAADPLIFVLTNGAN
jgi:hypothetical protein